MRADRAWNWLACLNGRLRRIFRGHPNYRGKGPWRDWVWVNWGDEGQLIPCHIWCFVVLEGLKNRRNASHFGGIKLNQDGVYAVVESSMIETNEEELGRSSIFIPIRKTVGLDSDGTVLKRHFFLAETSAFVDPCCAVADIGGPSNQYFVVKLRTKCSADFLCWVRDPHGLDEMDVLDQDDKLVKKKETSS